MPAVSARDLLPGEFAVLGLLGLRPMHGYEMARYFDRDDLTEVCPVEQSLLYGYLRNLEDRALVRWDEVRVGARPPRKRYELTSAGAETLAAWLREPVQRMREVRLELLLKLYFLHRSDPEAERTLLVRQIDVCDRYRERLARQVAEREGFDRLVAGSKLSAAESTTRWLRAYEAELAQGAA